MKTASWTPSFKQGYASSQALAAHPEAWDGLALNVHAPLGNTGGIIRDVSGRKNNGTNVGATFVPGGLLGGLWSMSGDNYINFGNAASLQEQSTLTVLVRWRETTGPSQGDTWVSRFDSGADKRSWVILYNADDDVVRFVLTQNGDTADNVKSYDFSAADTAIARDGDWHQFGFTFNSGTLALWLDGRVAVPDINTDQDIASLFADDVPVLLGGRPASGVPGSKMPGEFATCMIHNRVLTPNEIKALYHDPHYIVRPRSPITLVASDDVISGGPPVGSRMLMGLGT